MRTAFAFLILIHGLMHVMGFAKAFEYLAISQLSQDISKPTGVFWFLVSILFILSVILYFFKYEWWFVFAIFGVLMSQILIIMIWADAKFGTIPNLIILLVGLSAFGNHRFKTMVIKESNLIIKSLQLYDHQITKNDIIHLPSIVQKWMQASKVIGSEKVVSIRLKQVGEMRTEVEGKWMPFTAEQYVNTESISFIWTTNVKMTPYVQLVGRDKLSNGKGEMLVKAFALITVVDDADNVPINTGAMIRYLAEICWFPSGALNEAIIWEPIDSNTVKATLRIKDQSVSGMFKFRLNGDFILFEADRYYGGKANAHLEKWVVTAQAHKVFNGIKIPNRCRVSWKLKDGDFNWLNLEITDIGYNIDKIYES